MKRSGRDDAMKRLDIFEGDWKIEVIHPDFPLIYGLTSFTWMDGDSFLIQRTKIDQPEFPNNMMVYDYDSASGTYVQHYFDSRGVTRLFQMSLEDGIWKSWRDAPGFSQRFRGEINESSDTIHSTLEKSFDGVEWEYDFKMIYSREGK